MRNVSATEPLMKFAYDTSGFKNVDNSTYMFFRTAVSLSLSENPHVFIDLFVILGRLEGY